MKKPLIFSLAGALMLGGCASNSLETQVNSLSQRVNTLERDLNQAQEELAAIRGKRIVRLPTGAPTTTQARSTTPPAYTLSPEEKAYHAAMTQYKSGDAQGAANAFSDFVKRYPNAKQRDKALFSLGQAAYTMRDYPRARQALETLVYQPQDGKADSKAVDLLQRVYRAEGNSAGSASLDNYLQNLRAPSPAPTVPAINAPSSAAPTAPSIGIEQSIPATNAPQTGDSIIEAPSEPLRPATLQTF